MKRQKFLKRLLLGFGLACSLAGVAALYGYVTYERPIEMCRSHVLPGKRMADLPSELSGRFVSVDSPESLRWCRNHGIVAEEGEKILSYSKYRAIVYAVVNVTDGTIVHVFFTKT